MQLFASKKENKTAIMMYLLAAAPIQSIHSQQQLICDQKMLQILVKSGKMFLEGIEQDI